MAELAQGRAPRAFTASGREADAVARLGFAVLLVSAVILGFAEFVAWLCLALTCLGGDQVFCYGPQSPAAPGYRLGFTLEVIGAGATAVAATASVIGMVGLCWRWRRYLAVTVALLFVVGIATSTVAVIDLRAKPSVAWCLKHEHPRCIGLSW